LLFSDIWSKYNLSQRLDKLARVAEILDQAHRLGLSHNDVKPENFLINENGDVMLIDWNLAMPFGVKQYGTKGFRSPEWIKQDQSDVYGLAVSLRVIFKIPSSNRDPVEESLENFRQQMGQNDPDARPLMKDVVKVLRSLAQMAANDRAKGNVPISELSPGGIDLTPKRLKLDVDSANAAVSQPIDLKKMENEEINGLYIKDIEIKPLHHLPELLGASASA